MFYQVVAWGENNYGQLGDGTNTNRNVAVPVVGLPTDIVRIAAGGRHSLALRSDGTVYAWGANAEGQLGRGYVSGSGEPFPSPAPVLSATGGVLSGITELAGGGDHSLGLNYPFVYAWGDNQAGQLGNETVGGVRPSADWVTLKNGSGLEYFTGATEIAAGGYHGLFLSSPSPTISLYAWGSNCFGQLGDDYVPPYPCVHRPFIKDVTRAVAGGVSSLDVVKGMAAGGNHSLAVLDTRTLWAWGLNESGRLGDGTKMLRDRAVIVRNADGSAFFPVKQSSSTLAGGWFHSLAVKEDGTVWAFGAGFCGQLGTGIVTFDHQLHPLPVTTTPRGFFGKVVAVAAGSQHSVALLEDGTVWAWGDNHAGQVGNGTFTGIGPSLPPCRNVISLPTQVLNEDGTPLSGVVAIKANSTGDHTLALAPANPRQRPQPRVGGAKIDGVVTLQGRPAPRSPALPLPDTGHGIATITLGQIHTTNRYDGSFSIYDVPDGTYTLTAAAPGYLSASRSLTVVNGAAATSVPPVQLKAGDGFGQGVVGIGEIAAIAAAFGTRPINRVDAYGRIVDFNGDGVVDVGDVTAAAASFGKTSPQPW